MATRLKRGDTLVINISIKDIDGEPLALSVTPGSEEIQAQIRTYGGSLIASFVVTAGEEVGDYILTVADTTNFPIETLFYDVEYVEGTAQKSTETKKIYMVKDITTWA